MNSLLKNWKLVLIVIGFVLIVGAWQYDHAAQYKRGRVAVVVASHRFIQRLQSAAQGVI